MLAILLVGILSVATTPQTQTVTIGQAAQVTATIIRDTPTVDIQWSRMPGDGNTVTFKGTTVAIRPVASGPSHTQLSIPAQLTSTTQQITSWTFTKQGTYSFIITVRDSNGGTAQSTVTFNVKRK